MDLPRKWAGYIAQRDGVSTTISDHLALVHHGTDEAPNNEILFVVDGHLIPLLPTPDVPIDAVLSRARALDPSAPAFSSQIPVSRPSPLSQRS